MIPFNKPCLIGKESIAVQQSITGLNFSGNGPFGKKCAHWLQENLNCQKALLTPSCTAALEMSALLTEVGPGDEVIMPSYTFVSTANAYALRGASIRFVDVDPETMNIDPAAVEAAITDHTKVIVVVHYAGISCDMDAIMSLAEKHRLWVVEDAAQGLMSTYHSKPLGTIGHIGTISFHETKNYQCGEGGALLINHSSLKGRAEMIQEKGTNRSKFLRGEVDKYTWRDIGSSYLLSELNAAFLSVQLEHAIEIYKSRMRAWKQYASGLQKLQRNGKIVLPTVPPDCVHNAHMFYLKTSSKEERGELMKYLKEQGIMTVTHYVPLHSSLAGEKHGHFVGKDNFTTAESDKLLRLPLYYEMGEEAVSHVVTSIQKFYQY